MTKRDGGIFGGLFDFNNDGRTDVGEEWIAYQIMQEVMEPQDSGPVRDWRDTCVDGSEYGVYPYEYDTEAEYLEAIKREKYAWRDFCVVDYDSGIFPEDYETLEEYETAIENGWDG